MHVYVCSSQRIGDILCGTVASTRVGRTFELWSLLNFNKVTVAVSVVCRPLTRCLPQCLHLTAFSNSSKVQVKTGWRPLSYLLKVVSLPSVEQGWVPLWGHHPYSWFSRQVLFTHNLCLIYLWLTKMLRVKTPCFCRNRRITEMRRMLMWEGRCQDGCVRWEGAALPPCVSTYAATVAVFQWQSTQAGSSWAHPWFLSCNKCRSFVSFHLIWSY